MNSDIKTSLGVFHQHNWISYITTLNKARQQQHQSNDFHYDQNLWLIIFKINSYSCTVLCMHTFFLLYLLLWSHFHLYTGFQQTSHQRQAASIILELQWHDLLKNSCECENFLWGFATSWEERLQAEYFALSMYNTQMWNSCASYFQHTNKAHTSALSWVGNAFKLGDKLNVLVSFNRVYTFLCLLLRAVLTWMNINIHQFSSFKKSCCFWSRHGNEGSV